MRFRWGILFVACLLLVPGETRAKMGIGGRAGTLGLGVEGVVSILPRVNVRGGGQILNLGFDATESEVQYDLDLKFRSFSVLLDLYPAPTFGLHLTGGFVFNGNEASLVAIPQGAYDIGGTEYTGAEVGQLNGKMTFGETAPYLGLGWGNAAVRRVGFALDLGVALQGKPDVTLSATGPVAVDPAFVAELQQEEQEIEDHVELLRYYPVVSVGLNFRIW